MATERQCDARLCSERCTYMTGSELRVVADKLDRRVEIVRVDLALRRQGLEHVEKGEGEYGRRAGQCRRVQLSSEELLDRIPGCCNVVASTKSDVDGMESIDVHNHEIEGARTRVATPGTRRVAELKYDADVSQGRFLEVPAIPTLEISIVRAGSTYEHHA